MRQRSCIRGGLKIDGEVWRGGGKARGVITDEIDGFAKRPLVIPELTTRVRDDVNVCCPRARAPIFRRPDRQLYGHRQGRALRNAIIDAMPRCCCSQSLDHPRSLCDVDFARVPFRSASTLSGET